MWGYEYVMQDPTKYIIAERVELSYYESILLLNAFILAYSAHRIRKVYKEFQSNFTNERLVRVHIINSYVLTVLFIFSYVPHMAVERIYST